MHSFPGLCRFRRGSSLVRPEPSRQSNRSKGCIGNCPSPTTPKPSTPLLLGRGAGTMEFSQQCDPASIPLQRFGWVVQATSLQLQRRHPVALRVGNRANCLACVLYSRNVPEDAACVALTDSCICGCDGGTCFPQRGNTLVKGPTLSLSLSQPQEMVPFTAHQP